MNPEIKTKWLEALRSRKYTQGTDYLRGNGKYCCLGVLCDVVQPEKWGQEDAFGVIPHDPNRKFKFENNVYPSVELLDQVGLTEDQMQTLVDLNDGGKTFDEIAKYIEENL